MKLKIIFTICISTILLCSCEPTVTFDSPQPSEVKALTAFPKRLHGKYIAADHASTLTISDYLITRYYDFDFKEHKDSLGSSYKLIGDTLINLTDNSKEQVRLKGDTIFQRIQDLDTLFHISENNILKKLKGYYFLNINYGDDIWEVKKLALQKGNLIIASISDKDGIKKLKEISETTADTISSHFTLTRRQFKKFVKEDGFTEQEVFSRIAK